MTQDLKTRFAPDCELPARVRKSVQCTVYAQHARGELSKDGISAEVKGYFSQDNPTANAGAAVGGHDFCVVQDRWIVDLWLREVWMPINQLTQQPTEVVLDMEDEDDMVEVRFRYGDPSTWEVCDGSRTRCVA